VRVAVVDIGTNSTRLLIADVAQGGAVTEVVRHSQVTRLGAGLEQTGALAGDARQRVLDTLDRYRAEIDANAVETAVGVLTSAVRDASNGGEFTEEVRERYGLDARTIEGDEEAQLTFLGATSERADGGDAETVVIDIGGGSTEFVVGRGREVVFHVSTQAGVVRHSERHIASDPPSAEEMDALARDVRGVIEAGVPEQVRAGTDAAIAVAGTATSLGAIDLELEPYDPARVHGHRLGLARIEEILERLAGMTDEERRAVRGLHPDRAPTIVAGVILLREALQAFGLDSVEVSEHDILRGAALRAAGAG
jgi:exopolyphosphatase / guanosine-5'-triphosphate,3'-diphosphate pyrophosphatase